MGLQRYLFRKPDPEPPPPAPPRARRVVRVIPSRRDPCAIIGLTERDALTVRELTGPRLERETPWLALLNGAIAAGYRIVIYSDLETID